MKIMVKRNYITAKGRLHGPGDVLDLADQEAKRFLTSGQAEQVATPKPAAVKKKVEKAAPTLPDPAPEALKRKK
ncbi:hypothetical protein [Acidaminococcus sp.]|uniref:hypothetical protein n=1 Tax=Acidaminococcus sp. TaxID=1872103 RepID=UPI003D7D82C8